MTWFVTTLQVNPLAIIGDMKLFGNPVADPEIFEHWNIGAQTGEMYSLKV